MSKVFTATSMGEEMKTWIDKLREVPINVLEKMIVKEEQDIKIKQHDLDTMRIILIERIFKAEKPT